MADITFQCPACKAFLTFAAHQAGSVEHCPNPSCGQRVIVPGSASTALAPSPAAETAIPSQAQHIPQPIYHHEERSRESHVQRKLKMGAGCFAMLAVMFAVSLVGYGIAKIGHIPDEQFYGWTALIAGLAGVAAFVFFGYIATETAEASRDQGRR